MRNWGANERPACVFTCVQGIGLAVVQELCALGAKVRYLGCPVFCATLRLAMCIADSAMPAFSLSQVFLCSRHQSDVDACVTQLTQAGYSVQGAAADVSDPAQRQQLVQNVSDAFDGKLHILGGQSACHMQLCAEHVTSACRLRLVAGPRCYSSNHTPQPHPSPSLCGINSQQRGHKHPKALDTVFSVRLQHHLHHQPGERVHPVAAVPPPAQGGRQLGAVVQLVSRRCWGVEWVGAEGGGTSA